MAAFADPPAFTYVVVGHYLSCLGPVIASVWWSSSRHDWVGFAGRRRWVGFAVIGLCWRDSSSLGWIRPCWSFVDGRSCTRRSFVVGWDSSPLGWIRWRWSSLGWIRPLWSSTRCDFLSFAAAGAEASSKLLSFTSLSLWSFVLLVSTSPLSFRRHLVGSVGFKIVRVSQGKRDERKRATTNVVAHFRDAPYGPPISWVPPCGPPSPDPPSSENELPTSFWKGEGQLRLGSVLSLLGRWCLSQHPSQ